MGDGLYVHTSSAGKMMGLLKDSFLNYENHIRLDYEFIDRKIGDCPYIDEILGHLILTVLAQTLIDLDKTKEKIYKIYSIN
ncbi:MAG: hypothetical protein ACTIKE_14285, partial [Sphingobacterium sp.]